MLRMVISQPPTEVTRMVNTGSAACRSSELHHPALKVSPGKGSRAPLSGNHLSWNAKTYSRISPNQKYGMAFRNSATGVRPSATARPRRHPLYRPRALPSTKEMTVVTPIRPSVYGRAVRTTSMTGVGNRLIERPKSPRTRLPR